MRTQPRHPLKRALLITTQRARVLLAAVSSLGDITFTASTDHAAVVSYEARLYADGTVAPQLSTYDLGKPVPNGTLITVHGFYWLRSQVAGDYQVRVAAIGSTGLPGLESAESNAFTIPLTSA